MVVLLVLEDPKAPCKVWICVAAALHPSTTEVVLERCAVWHCPSPGWEVRSIPLGIVQGPSLSHPGCHQGTSVLLPPSQVHHLCSLCSEFPHQDDSWQHLGLFLGNFLWKCQAGRALIEFKNRKKSSAPSSTCCRRFCTKEHLMQMLKILQPSLQGRQNYEVYPVRKHNLHSEHCNKHLMESRV